MTRTTLWWPVVLGVLCGACGTSPPEASTEETLPADPYPHTLIVHAPDDSRLGPVLEGAAVELRGGQRIGQLVRTENGELSLRYDAVPKTEPIPVVSFTLLIPTPCGVHRHLLGYVSTVTPETLERARSAGVPLRNFGDIRELGRALEWRRAYVERGDSAQSVRVGERELPDQSGEIVFPTLPECTQAPVLVGDEQVAQWSAGRALFVNLDETRCFRYVVRTYEVLEGAAGDAPETASPLGRGAHSLELPNRSDAFSAYLTPFPEAVRSGSLVARLAGVQEAECADR